MEPKNNHIQPLFKLSPKKIKSLNSESNEHEMLDQLQLQPQPQPKLVSFKLNLKILNSDQEVEEETLRPINHFQTDNGFHSKENKPNSKESSNISKTEVTFDKLKQNLHKYEKNDKMKNKKNRPSSLLQSLYSFHIKKKKKFTILVKHYLIPHIIANILAVLFLLSHKIYNNFCFTKPLCVCDRNLNIQIYSASYIIFSDFCILAYGAYLGIVEIYLPNEKINFMIVSIYFLIIFTLSYAYIIWSAEDILFNEWPIQILILGTSSIFMILVLFFQLKLDFKQIISNLRKSSILGVSLLIHYLLIRVVFPRINDQIPEIYAVYVVPLYQLLYFRIMSVIFPKAINIYYNHIIGLNPKIRTIALNCQIRFIQTFLLTVPLTSVLNLSIGIQHIFNWFLLITYGNFIILTYTQVDLMKKYVFLPIYSLIFCRKKKKENIQINQNQNEILCTQIICGNLLDLIYIINSKLILWKSIKIWLIYPSNIKYYLNCNFDIDFSTFQISNLGIILIILVNSLITFAVFFYMYYKNRILFEYKTISGFKNHAINIISLYFTSLLIDNNVQMSFSLKT